MRRGNVIVKTGLRRCDHEWTRALRWRLPAKAMMILLATAHHDGHGKGCPAHVNFPDASGDGFVASSGGVGVGGVGVGGGVIGGGAPCAARCFDQGGTMVFSEVLFEISSFERLFAKRAVDFSGDAPRRVRSQLGPRSGLMTPLACARLHDARCQLNPHAAGSELHRRAAAVGQFAATNGAAVIGNVRRGHHPLVAAGAHACTANAADVGFALEDERAAEN